MNRLEGTREVEDKKKEYNNIKGFVGKYKHHTNLMSDYKITVQHTINIINETVSNFEYSRKKITIGTIVEYKDIEDIINNLRSILLWVLEDV